MLMCPGYTDPTASVYTPTACFSLEKKARVKENRRATGGPSSPPPGHRAVTARSPDSQHTRVQGLTLGSPQQPTQPTNGLIPWRAQRGGFTTVCV